MHPAPSRTGGWNPLAAPPRTAKTRSFCLCTGSGSAVTLLRRPPPAQPAPLETRRRAAEEGGRGGGDIIHARLWLGRPRAASEGGLRPSLITPRRRGDTDGAHKSCHNLPQQSATPRLDLASVRGSRGVAARRTTPPLQHRWISVRCTAFPPATPETPPASPRPPPGPHARARSRAARRAGTSSHNLAAGWGVVSSRMPTRGRAAPKLAGKRGVGIK